MSATLNIYAKNALGIGLLMAALWGNLSVIASEVTHTKSDSTLKVTAVGKQFFKIGQNSERLSDDSQIWSCVEDADTSLFWQKRDPTSALHGHDSYNWFQPGHDIPGEPRSNPDLFGIDATCFGYRADDPNSYCNTDAYIRRINQSNYCGYSDWRLPTVNELLSLVDPSLSDRQNQSAIDLNFFPFNQSFAYWTDSVDEKSAVIAIFNEEKILKNLERTDHLSVRLVRGSYKTE